MNLKIETIADIEIKDIAKKLAHESNFEQGEFFNEFFKEFLTFENGYISQLCFISDKLDKNSIMILKELVELTQI